MSTAATWLYHLCQFHWYFHASRSPLPLSTLNGNCTVHRPSWYMLYQIQFFYVSFLMNSQFSMGIQLLLIAFSSSRHDWHTVHRKILAGEKLVNRELFTKILFTNIHKYTEAIWTDCSLFAKFFLAKYFPCMVNHYLTYYLTIANAGTTKRFTEHKVLEISHDCSDNESLFWYFL